MPPEETVAPDATENVPSASEEDSSESNDFSQALSEFRDSGGFEGWGENQEDEDVATATADESLEEEESEEEEVVENEEIEEGAPEPEDEVAPEPDVEGEDEASEDEPSDDSAEEPVLVEIPGRREGETLNIEVVDEETANALRMVANNGMRRAEFNKQMESVRSAQSEIRQFLNRVETDPSSLILEKATTATRLQIVRDVLLSDPDVLKQVSEQIYEMENDPSAASRYRAEMERDVAVRQSKVVKMNTEAARYHDAAVQITNAVQSLVPDDIPEDVADAFLNDAYDYLEYLADKPDGFERVTPESVPELLESRLKLHGITPSSPGDSNGKAHGGRAAPSKAPSRPTARLVQASEAEAEDARQTGEKLTQRSRKARSSATAPAGAGAVPSTGLKPPAKQNIDQRVEWMKKNMGKFGFPK